MIIPHLLLLLLLPPIWMLQDEFTKWLRTLGDPELLDDFSKQFAEQSAKVGPVQSHGSTEDFFSFFLGGGKG